MPIVCNTTTRQKIPYFLPYNLFQIFWWWVLCKIFQLAAPPTYLPRSITSLQCTYPKSILLYFLQSNCVTFHIVLKWKWMTKNWASSNIFHNFVFFICINSYNSMETSLVSFPLPLILGKNLSVSGFHFFDYLDRMDESRIRLSGWVENGQLKGCYSQILCKPSNNNWSRLHYFSLSCMPTKGAHAEVGQADLLVGKIIIQFVLLKAQARSHWNIWLIYGTCISWSWWCFRWLFERFF